MAVTELRILFIIGLMITAVVAYMAAVGMFAAARWLSGQVFSRRAPVKEATGRPRSRAGTIPIRADAERGPHLRQAAWRLRC